MTKGYAKRVINDKKLISFLIKARFLILFSFLFYFPHINIFLCVDREKLGNLLTTTRDLIMRLCIHGLVNILLIH